MVEFFTLALLILFICSGLVITWLTPMSVLNTPVTCTDNQSFDQAQRAEATINTDVHRGFSFSSTHSVSDKIKPTHIMKKLFILLLVSGFMAISQVSTAQSVSDMEGTWTGDIKGTPIEFTFSPYPDRGMTMKLNNVSQTLIGYVPIERYTSNALDNGSENGEDDFFYIVVYTNINNSSNLPVLYAEFAGSSTNNMQLNQNPITLAKQSYIAKVQFTDAGLTEMKIWVDYNRDGFNDTVTATEYKLSK
ncbi:MAG TPA: hypothetical protein PKH65_00180 [Bacteroidia bacterium]|nr:hypothetical protein [Bacteroidia bacterium]HNT79069.1 hypothetical protein [Bacteroidia bacterium]